MKRPLAAALLCLAAAPAAAAECRALRFEDTPFTVCEVDPAEDDLRLLWGENGEPYGQFGAAEDAAGRPFVFAMNGGMYHDDLRPVGHFVQDGQEIAPLVTNKGPGNFGMLPNGVLCLTDGSARVIETLRFEEEAPECRDASQSGPMLVIDGALHPRFRAASDSRLLRNGVGTSDSGDRAVFAISDAPVNFHTFARLFRDGLGLPNALYLDGNVSRLKAPGVGRDDAGFAMGPMVGVLAD